MKASCSTDSTSKYSADIGGRRSRGDFRVFTEGARQKRGNGYFQSDLLYAATKKPLRRYTGACDVGLVRIGRCPQLSDMWLKKIRNEKTRLLVAVRCSPNGTGSIRNLMVDGMVDRFGIETKKPLKTGA